MFSFSKLGSHGNLGNQLFEIASTIGLADKHGVDCVFPEWKYAQYFKNYIRQSKEINFDMQVTEPHYHYANLILDTGRNVDLLGWFQSEKYWKDCEEKVRNLFKWEEKLVYKLTDEFINFFDKPTVAISVRRGDYVGNENYHQLSLKYYKQAAEKLEEKYGKCQFFIFSDDPEYCKENFIGSNTIIVDHLDPIEQLCLGSFCDHFIIANSSFSWWMAYLGEKMGSKVIAPAFWNAGELLNTADDKDVVPERWERFNPDLVPAEKIDLSDVLFTIPVKYDHPDRKQNLDLSLRFLLHHFKTNILVSEMDHSPKFDYVRSADVMYRFYKMDKSFERTRMLNDGARDIKSTIVVNWDCDVFMRPSQILEGVNLIREGKASGVYPYDGRFFRCDRKKYFEELRKTLSVEIFVGKSFDKYQHTTTSYGGAVMWNVEDFIKGGMENEFMIHYGPEDFERYERFTKLGFKVERIKGPLFHMDHHTGNNGSKGHDFRQENDLEYQKVRRMNPEQLKAYVKTWPWNKPQVKTNTAGAINDLMPDKIYCLNLENRVDRKEHSIEIFKKLGIDDYSFFPAIEGKETNLTLIDSRITPGMIGCYESHKAMLKDALDNNYEMIIVFEDDLKPLNGINQFLKQALPMIPEDWEFAYLGCTEYEGPTSYKKKINEYWVVPKCAWGTQGYMIRTRAAIQKVYDMICKPQERQIDEELANHVLPESGLKYYSIYPSAFSQEFELLGSDVQKLSPKK